MHKIEISKRYNIQLFEELIKKVIRKNSSQIYSKNECNEELYEVEGGGAIFGDFYLFEHQTYARIILAGFDNNKKKFEEIKSKLEEISKIDENNIEEIKKIFDED